MLLYSLFTFRMSAFSPTVAFEVMLPSLLVIKGCAGDLFHPFAAALEYNNLNLAVIVKSHNRRSIVFEVMVALGLIFIYEKINALLKITR